MTYKYGKHFITAVCALDVLAKNRNAVVITEHRNDAKDYLYLLDLINSKHIAQPLELKYSIGDQTTTSAHHNGFIKFVRIVDDIDIKHRLAGYNHDTVLFNGWSLPPHIRNRFSAYHI